MAQDPKPPSTPRGPAAVTSSAQIFVHDLDVLAVTREDAHHLSRSLRLRPGEPVVAADGHGNWRMCLYRSEASDGAVLEPDGEIRQEARPTPTLTVAFVPVKGDRPEWAVQKLTELGVDRIIVLRSARAVVRWDGDRAGRALERLRRVSMEAAAQSRRAWLPEVAGPATLSEVGGLSRPAELYLADADGQAPGPDLTALAVGPEGGWDDAERQMGFLRVRLGSGILRSETATVAGGALLCALRDGVVRAL